MPEATAPVAIPPALRMCRIHRSGCSVTGLLLASASCSTDEADVEASHAGDLYAVDDSGTVVMQWPFGTGHGPITRDVRSLLAQVDPPT